MVERVEQKFYIPPSRLSHAMGLLRRSCRWDRDYPEEQINSLYFDTRDLDQHERSLAGEYSKDKIRIRWYGTEYDPHLPSKRTVVPATEATTEPAAEPAAEATTFPVWLELKSRRGFVSTKQRRMMQVAGDALSPGRLVRGILPLAELIQTMAAFGFFTQGRLCPVVAISYWRQRFVEPRTGFHVALDSHIRSTAVMPGIGRGERGLELPGAVVEVKGPVLELPAPVQGIAGIGSSWTRYSKYSSSLDAHGAARGSVSRLWPSGVMDAGAGILGRVGADRDARGPRPAKTARRFLEEYETE